MYSYSKFSAERADRLEDYWRDFAFLGLNTTLQIAGGWSIEVQLLTLRMFTQLCAVRSPFLVGGRVGPEHISQILWRLSPHYDGRNHEARTEFIGSISDLPYRSTRRTIDRFLDRMLIDRPAQSAQRKSSNAKADTSFAASMIHTLAGVYGWNGEQILDLPMPQLFQYLKKIHRSGNPDAAPWNPIRDKFIARWMAKRKLALAARQNGNK